MTNAVISSLNTFRTPTDHNILNTEHEDFDVAKRLDRFEIANIEYVRSDSLVNLKEPRMRESSIWQFGEELLRTTDAKEVYYC